MYEKTASIFLFGRYFIFVLIPGSRHFPCVEGADL